MKSRKIVWPIKPVAFNKAVFLFSVLVCFLVTAVRGQSYTKGIGIYPGDPKENFAPTLKPDLQHYRNLALHRASYQSSAYDYNLTAQLITDGIVETGLPGWIVTSTSTQGLLLRDGREHVIDRHGSTQQQLDGAKVWVQVQMAGKYQVPLVDSFSLAGNVTLDTLAAKPWKITISGSNDGVKWNIIGNISGNDLVGIEGPRFNRPQNQKPTPQQLVFIRRFAGTRRRSLNYGFKLNKAVNYTYYRLDAESPNAKNWSVSNLTFLYQGKEAPVGGPYHFNSAWKSAGSGEEWVYVDLGAPCSFNQFKLNWISPAATGFLQVSNDAKGWETIAPLPTSENKEMNIQLQKQVQGRYARVLMNKPANPEQGYILSEIAVMGTGGPIPTAHAQPGVQPNGRLDLAGGQWKLQRASEVKASGATLSSPSYNDGEWPVATVPATILTSFVNNGAVPEPNYGDNNEAISDAYFYDDFWYRDVFTAPASYQNKRVFLNFDGINWKAEVYLNGHLLGHIDGAFIRGQFDVTGQLLLGSKNVLAVRVIKNETPGFATEQNQTSTDANGGELGADNPTFHASVGWDWIPTIRGRNTGIWNDVFLTQTGSVTIENPLITSRLPLPDTSSAAVSMEVTLHNHGQQSVKGVLHGKIGAATFEQAVVLNASEEKTLKLTPASIPALKLQHPKLWWPNGYGQQNLYDVNLSFTTSDGKESDNKAFKTGIREMTYSDTGNLKIYVNGKRFIARGGNMGFSEDLLRYRGREYDIAVRYHKEMNFNMIRNWVGQIGDDEFFEACDKYGITIWQDFWLANPGDGPNPAHPDMFINNMEDFVKRIRNHPSIALYVGRNEGNPPPVIQQAIDKELPVLAPGIRYIPNSASYTVSGGGPYGLQPMKFYFENRATPKLHSEMGMPDIMSNESMKLTLPDSALWPQSRLWGVHDFTLQGAQSGGNFNKTLEQAFGKINRAQQWLSLASWLEYQGYRAMFEAQSKNRMGLLIWMSHPSWPTLVWQSYDYYFEPTAAYFGAKIASEPLHIQWNPLSDSVEVVNYSSPAGAQLLASLQVLDMNGKIKYSRQAAVNCLADHTVAVMPVSVPSAITGMYLLRLKLTKGNMLISQNEYIRGAQPDSSGGIGNLSKLTQLPMVKPVVQTQLTKAANGSRWKMAATVSNHSAYAAFNLQLKVLGDTSKQRILPVIISDNYFTLLPGETRTVLLEVANRDTRGEKPTVKVEGFNVNP